MFTGLPAAATARMKLVCRQRNAGVCSTSTTAATSAISFSSCTSVSTGTQIWRLTSARMRRPSVMPGPRYDVDELRLALSYDDLNMNGTPSPAHISFNLPATSICNCSDSTTHGPAIRNRGLSSPASNPHRFMVKVRLSGDELRARPHRITTDSAVPLERGVDVGDEQWMAAARIRRELGVELTAEKPRMVTQLDHFAQVAGGGALRPRTDREPGGFDSRQIVVVDLVAMAMALGNRRRAIDLVRKRSGHDLARLRSEAHGAPEVGRLVAALDGAVAVLPFADQRDDGMRRPRIELRAVGAFQTRLVASVFDDGELHAEADAKIRNAVFARVPDRTDLALDTALAEATGH